MKKISSSTPSLLNVTRQRLFANNTERLLSTYQTRINTELDYLDSLGGSFQTPTENITLQNLVYAMNSQFSTKKSNIISSYKAHTSSKITVDYPHEKGNISFFTDLVTASRYTTIC